MTDLNRFDKIFDLQNSQSNISQSIKDIISQLSIPNTKLFSNGKYPIVTTTPTKITLNDQHIYSMYLGVLHVDGTTSNSVISSNNVISFGPDTKENAMNIIEKLQLSSQAPSKLVRIINTPMASGSSLIGVSAVILANDSLGSTGNYIQFTNGNNQTISGSTLLFSPSSAIRETNVIISSIGNILTVNAIGP